jgi:tetratricopeptide (TPR) repeat protein
MIRSSVVMNREKEMKTYSCSSRLGWILLGIAISLLKTNLTGADDPATAPSPDSKTLWLDNATFTKKLDSGRLQRELFRQAVLIAARDGLGLSTRDQALREWREEPPASRTLVPKIDGRLLMLQIQPPAIDARRTQGLPPDPQDENANPSNPSIWHVQLNKPEYSQDIASTAKSMEKLSRSAFVKALEQAGFPGTANLEKLNAPAPDDAEARLAKLEALSQFAVLRETHQVIHADGESQQRLGALVRAYANLGQITRFHWSLENQVYFARALLYANRMVAASPNTSFALWHRAYALAFAGLQDAALKDIESATKLGNDSTPPWSVLLEPYCKYQTKQLSDLADQKPSLEPLARYLAFVTVENSGWGCKAFPLAIGRTAAQANPDCLQVIETMCDYTGVGLVFDLTDQGEKSFSHTLGTDLAKIPGFPTDIAKMIDTFRQPGGNPTGREQVCQALIDAGIPGQDQVEPSWCALARLIEETTFAQVRLQQEVNAIKLDAGSADYTKVSAPWVADHPYKALIDAYVGAYDPNKTAAKAAMEGINVENLTVAAYPMLRLAQMLEPKGDPFIVKTRKAIAGNADLTSFDLSRIILANRDDLNTTFVINTGAKLLHADSNSPLGMAVSIETDWDNVKNLAADLEAKQGDQPTIALALGKQFRKLVQWENAERCLKRYVAVSPDLTGYRLLAESYRSQGKVDLWLSTLQHYLVSTPDNDLTHARVQVDIANYYMDKKLYDKALPYADAAGQSGAEWAVECDARVHEAMGDQTTAQQLTYENKARYSRNPYAVFEAAVLAGQGDRDSVAKQAEADFQSKSDQLNTEQLAQWASMEMIEKDYVQATKIWQIRMTKNPGPLSALHIAILADETHDIATRDAELKKVSELPDQDSSLCRFAGTLRNTIAAGDTAVPDAKEIDADLAGSQLMEKVSAYYLAACFLDQRGHKDLATTYFEKCVTPGPSDRRENVEQLLAYDALRSRGIDPMALQAATTRPTAN